MAQNNNASTNGAENKPPTGETAKATAAKLEKPELSNLSVGAAKSKLPPIEERLKKLEQLQELADRREVLLQHIDNLSRFYVSDSGGCNLKLTDSKGNSFGIAHPIIIGEIVAMSTHKLRTELDEIESKLDFKM